MIMNLLQIVQGIILSMDGEEITTWNQNYESRQVANIVQEVYLNLVPRMNRPTDFTMFQLAAPPGGSSASYPTICSMPINCTSWNWLKYDCHLSSTTDPLFTDMVYITPNEFFNIMTQWAPSADNTITQFSYIINGEAVNFEVSNNHAPTYFTSWDDYTIAFDSFDSSVDSFINPSKTQVFGKLDQSFTLADSYIPNLRSEQFPLLFQEAKSLAWAQMKQIPHVKAEREAKRQWTHYGKSRYTGPNALNNWQRLPNYGRSSPGFSVRRLWDGDVSGGDGNFNTGFDTGYEH